MPPEPAADDEPDRSEVKRIRFTAEELQRFNDAWHDWSKGKRERDTHLADFCMDLIARPAAPPPPPGRAGVAVVPSRFISGGTEDPNWKRSLPPSR